MRILDVVQGTLRSLGSESADHACEGGIAYKLCHEAIFVTRLVRDARQPATHIGIYLHYITLQYINRLTAVDITVLARIS